MIIDWGEAVRVGVVGFGVVFLVLVILAVVIWLTGIVIGKIGNNKNGPAAAETNGESKKK